MNFFMIFFYKVLFGLAGCSLNLFNHDISFDIFDDQNRSNNSQNSENITEMTPFVVTGTGRNTTDRRERPDHFSTVFPINPNVTTRKTPVTTQTPFPTPTIPPQPEAPSVPWNFSYSAKGNYCIMAELAIRIEIVYVNVLGQKVETGIDILPNSTVDEKNSECKLNSTKQRLALNFRPHFRQTENGLIVYQFSQDQNRTKLTDLFVMFIVDDDVFPGINVTNLGKTIMMSSSNLSMFESKSQHSFQCESMLKWDFDSIEIQRDVPWEVSERNNKYIKEATIEANNIKVQAFLPWNQHVKNFSEPTICSQDNDNDINSTIPLIVGGVLMFMVCAVLIAYCIGRRNSEPQNYDSM